MLSLDSLAVPTLLLHEDRARANIRRMAQKCAQAGVAFRPHFKTHQSAQVGEWFRDEGVSAITVSSLRMAEYFAGAREGAAVWGDITVAFPLNVREMERVRSLAGRVRLGLLVDSPAAIHALGRGVGAPVDVWLEVDTGYQRSGLDSGAVGAFAALLDDGSRYPHLRVRGLLTHTGHSYAAGTDFAALHAQTASTLRGLRDLLVERGSGPLEISVGDTPIASTVDDFGPVDELRPGNFIFYDWMQHSIGVCREEEIAVAVACPVVAVYPQRCEVVIYGGAVHLSKDFLRRADGALDFGHVAPLALDGWGAAIPDTYLRSLSQEHGIVHATPAAFERHLSQLAVGDLIAVLPIHSCLTADLLKEYLTLDGRRLGMMTL